MDSALMRKRAGGVQGNQSMFFRRHLGHVKAISFLTLLACVGLSGCEEPSAPMLEVWPLPADVSRFGEQVPFLQIARRFELVLICNTTAKLQTALVRYHKMLFPRRLPAMGHDEDHYCLQQLQVCIYSSGDLPAEEDYELNISAHASSLEPPVATLKAQSDYGALHGLETFSQLVVYDRHRAAYGVRDVPMKILDRPRFHHRGLLLDTARHYFPVGTILRTLDAMAATKLNVLHWHMIDSEALPVEVKSESQMWDASWSDREIYTQEDIQDVIEYAHDRGIRVLPELDVPGHSRAWYFVLPDLFPEGGCQTKWWAMDPSRNATFETLGRIFKELTTVFKGQLFHVGGDEVGTSVWGDVRFDCWHHLRRWARGQGFTSFSEVLGYFMKHVIERLHLEGKRPVVWDEVWRQVSDLPGGVVVQVWEDPKLIKDIAETEQYDIIASPVGAWYLDDLETSWQKMYTYEPTNGLTSASHIERVLGGEAALWAELVDGATLDSVVWPRAAAVAERLWSHSLVGTALLDSPENIPSATVRRMASFRCLLLERGVGASPLDGIGRKGLTGPSSCYGHSVLPLEQAARASSGGQAPDKQARKRRRTNARDEV
mmetsp:Transcript_34948/g.78567  ORF Transcript_34948/g.78567 Transcript_34948/m.78567 type:complete len:602 (+) Transcript_34948:82-1887(+)